MFTLDQIKAAHSKVQSGADFPAYIQDLKKLGLSRYEIHVIDGHATYFGANNYRISSSALYEPKTIRDTSDPEQFKSDLKAHQVGKTTYPEFCEDASKSGIGKWVVLLDEMTCTYFGKTGEEILVEAIAG